MDPRFQSGAYITDGEDLYYVQRSAITQMRSQVLIVEDCLINATIELEYVRVEELCSLVRAAPAEQPAPSGSP